MLRADAYRWAERWVPPAGGPVNLFLSPPFADLAAGQVGDFLRLVDELMAKAPDESVLVIQAEDGFPADDLPGPGRVGRPGVRAELLLFRVKGEGLRRRTRLARIRPPASNRRRRDVARLSAAVFALPVDEKLKLVETSGTSVRDEIPTLTALQLRGGAARAKLRANPELALTWEEVKLDARRPCPLTSSSPRGRTGHLPNAYDWYERREPGLGDEFLVASSGHRRFSLSPKVQQTLSAPDRRSSSVAFHTLCL